MRIKDIGLSISESEYREINAASYSGLSGISRDGYRSLRNKFVHNSATKFGILAESLLFGDYDENDYYFLDDSVISEGKLKSACDTIFRLIWCEKPSEDLQDYITDIELILSEHYIDYWDKKESKWRAEKIVKESSEYWKHVVNSSDKMVMTNKAYRTALIAVKTLLEHKFTSNIFATSSFFDVEKISQFKIEFKYKGYKFKAMLDWLVVDHDNKVISPYDLKTGGKEVEEFEDSFYYWRYDIQSYLYSIAVTLVRNKYYPDYKVSPFKFIYISREDPYRPLIWIPTSKHYEGTQKGFYKDGNYYKGVDALIEEFIWFSSNEDAQYAESVYASNGEMSINDNITISNAKD